MEAYKPKLSSEGKSWHKMHKTLTLLNSIMNKKIKH